MVDKVVMIPRGGKCNCGLQICSEIESYHIVQLEEKNNSYVNTSNLQYFSTVL